ADIQHDRTTLSRLVAQTTQADLHLASVMVKLRCDSVWEKLLIPAFVFFFQKLYPFRWVNDPTRSTAAAAGGCILVRRNTLTAIGGIAAIRHALIDDCALAFAIKHHKINRQQELEQKSNLKVNYLSEQQDQTPDSDQLKATIRSPFHAFNPIWLGLSQNTYSLRPYPDLKSIWEMVARTAYTQLNYSPLLLLGTLIGMGFIYLVAPIALLTGLLTHQFLIAAIGLLTWLLMALAYAPTIQFYRCSPLFTFSLPLIAFLYTLMTIDSARRHWQGKGGAWKGRVYSAE
ncbi:MAG TPA: glycosyltransferase, partial [Allocoleopsis sp.]